MSRGINIIIITVLLLYVILYRTTFTFYGEVIQYIINPVIWILFFALTYFLLPKGKIILKYKKDIIYIVIASSLVYNILFYVLGVFVGYAKNPHSLTISGIIINLFSVYLVVIVEEYIRNKLVNIVNSKYNLLYYIFIFLIFFLAEFNILTFIRYLKSSKDIVDLLGKEIIPLFITNFFMMYLCKVGGFIPSFLYRSIILLPTLFLYILPKYSGVIVTLFNLLTPLFTYLIIKYMIDKKEKRLPARLLKTFEPKKWIVTFVIAILLVAFGLGALPIKPVVILSASMKPDINLGDLVIIKKSDINDIKVGEIIEYQYKNIKVVHRVVKIYSDNNNKELILKGDNNKFEDPNMVTKDQIIGKMIYRIPFLGYPTYLIYKLINHNNVEVETGT